MMSKYFFLTFLSSLLLQPLFVSAQIFDWEVGLTADRTVIRAQRIGATAQPAPTILYLAGLNGASGAADQLQSLLQRYAQLETQARPVNLIIIGVANPDNEAFSFPPQGDAYIENPVAHALWRWIGTHAPDLIIVENGDDSGFATAVQTEGIAGFGQLPVQLLSATNASLDYLLDSSALPTSPARVEFNRRISRTPQQLAAQLAESYGYDFSTPAYVPGMSVIGRLRLGATEAVAELISDYLGDVQVAVSNASVMAGQLVFAEFAERTGSAVALQLAIAAADLAFDAQGNPLEVAPMHNEMSDAFFMATPLLTKVGKLTGDPKYFEMAARHVNYMRNLLLRDNGLYRHSPEADVAWSRGNGFPALGLALTLSDLPQSHPAYGSILDAFVNHLQALRPHQDEDGMWHEVIDYPGSFAEITSTAMIGIAMKRGIDRGWLPANVYQAMLDKSWRAVSSRTSFDGEFINACTSTGKMTSLDAYLDRLAIFGRDDRAGGMVMNFAIEMAGIK
ncbi:MAG: glycoside hydrolase family 88 protein [Proteobacteria bacterium]|nr:glycoside hydrolase family 88 protein [Pseudomonadota bacterium]